MIDDVPAPDQSLWVVLTLTIAAGQEAAWEAYFAAMRAKVVAEEPGTLKFDLYRREGASGLYMMIEHFADRAAWEAHSRLQAARGIAGEMQRFQATPPDFHFLQPVGGSFR